MDLLFNDTLFTSEDDSTAAGSVTYDYLDSNNLTEYVFDLGPKRDALSSVIPVTVIYVLIFISGLFGNVCTCAVIIRNRHMRTATNYYLFSLAVSDLLLLVFGLPQELYQLWYKYPYVFGEAFCILRGFTSEMSTNASILTITCFTMERYIAICHPIRSHTMSKLSRVVKLIFAVWSLGGLCAVPMAIQFGVVVQDYRGRLISETAECTIKYPLENAFASSTFCFFIIPMAIISVLYAMIAIELRKSESPNRLQQTNEAKEPVLNGQNGQISFKKPPRLKISSRQSSRSIRGTKVSSRKAVIKMLFAVVVAFFICWAPFHAQRLMAIYVRNQTPTAVMVYTVLTHISGVTYYVSATINPILYSIMSNKFREAFKTTLAHCCRKNVHYGRASSRYTSVLRASMHKNSLGRSRRHDNSIQYRDIENNECKTQNCALESLNGDSTVRDADKRATNGEEAGVT